MRKNGPEARLFGSLLLLFVAWGCGEGGDEGVEKSSLDDLFQYATGEALAAALDAREEGDALLEEGRGKAGVESYRRAFDLLRRALEEQVEPRARAEVLNLLANTAVEIGRGGDPGFLGRAVSYANTSLAEGLDPTTPWLNKGLAYALAGMRDEAQQIFEMLLTMVGEADRRKIVGPLLWVYYEQAKEILMEDRIDARVMARRKLGQAFPYRDLVPAGAPIEKLLSQLGKAYEVEADEAVDDPLESARVHSRYGFAQPAGAQALAKAQEERGRDLEVRWVEARFVEEMDGSRESLESAAKHYRKLMSQPERAVHAAEGLGRVLMALDRGDEALDRLGRYPTLTGELRRVLILLRLRRIEGLPPENTESAEGEFAEIEALLSEGMAERLRVRLVTKVAVTAIYRKDRARLGWAIDKLTRRDPTDLRVPILDAEHQALTLGSSDGK